MHRLARSSGGKSCGAHPRARAARFSAGALRKLVHEVVQLVRVAQDETVILIIHQIILDAFHPYRHDVCGAVCTFPPPFAENGLNAGTLHRRCTLLGGIRNAQFTRRVRIWSSLMLNFWRCGPIAPPPESPGKSFKRFDIFQFGG